MGWEYSNQRTIKIQKCVPGRGIDREMATKAAPQPRDDERSREQSEERPRGRQQHR